MAVMSKLCTSETCVGTATKQARERRNLHRTRETGINRVNLRVLTLRPFYRFGGRVRCGICGNENAESNYFCGMCGAALTAKTPIAAKAPPTQTPTARRQSTTPPQTPQPAAQSPRAQIAEPTRTPLDLHPEQDASPVITGPSFLGLNKPTTGRSEPALRDSQVHDQLQHSSRNLDYLLEDEYEPKRGSGKLILLVVALLLAAGFGYLRWKQGGFDWLIAGNKNPAAVTPTTAGLPGNTADSLAPTATATDAASTPAAAPSTGSPSQSSASTSGSGDSATAPAGGGAAPATAQSAAPQTNSPQANPAQPAPDQPAPAPSPRSVSADSNPTPDSASTSQPSDSDAKASQLPAITRPRERKPSPARPVDPITEAERYIYGRGVRQDCDRGIKMLKPAAEQSNARAMISLGALYSTGTCAPRDLPTAYRWFALALHKEPDNQSLQDDLQKLWGQMTPPERQLAIKLSQ